MSNNRDYLYTEEVQLPSKGLFNPEIPNGMVTLRCIELRDQKYLAGSKLVRSNKAIELLRRCIVSPEGMNVEDLTQIDLFFLLVKLRVLSYGPEYKYYTNCPNCGKSTTVTVDLSKLDVAMLEDFNPNDLHIKLPRKGDTVYTRVQTQRDSDEINAEVSRLKSKYKDIDYDPEVTLSIAKIITKIELIQPDKEGNKVVDNPVDILNYVEGLTDLDALAIQSTLSDIDYGVIPVVTNECEKCGKEFSTMMKTTGDFFRPRFNR